jgi:hypothetical protein
MCNAAQKSTTKPKHRLLIPGPYAVSPRFSLTLLHYNTFYKSFILCLTFQNITISETKQNKNAHCLDWTFSPFRLVRFGDTTNWIFLCFYLFMCIDLVHPQKKTNGKSIYLWVLSHLFYVIFSRNKTVTVLKLIYVYSLADVHNAKCMTLVYAKKTPPFSQHIKFLYNHRIYTLPY